jgi:hypothetical protein
VAADISEKPLDLETSNKTVVLAEENAEKMALLLKKKSITDISAL